MTPNWQEIDAILCAAYRDEAQCYSDALALTNQLPSSLPDQDGIAPVLQRITEIMNKTAEIDNTISACRQQWRAAKREPSPALAAALQEITSLIEKLQMKIAELEKQATAKRDLLIPQMDSMLRIRQMQRAYGATTKRFRS
jgi:hypothetical protein